MEQYNASRYESDCICRNRNYSHIEPNFIIHQNIINQIHPLKPVHELKKRYIFGGFLPNYIEQNELNDVLPKVIEPIFHVYYSIRKKKGIKLNPTGSSHKDHPHEENNVN